MPVESIGGFFFRARDPDSLATWYAEHLGIGPGLGRTTKGAEGPYWRIGGGPVVFQPFPESTTYFAPDHHYMLNFRVSNLEGMLTRFERSGIAAETRPEWDDPVYGRFARIHDPEGNPIELWEPPAPVTDG
jgi:hypothetical protein